MNLAVDWLLNLIVKWILASVKDGTIEKLAQKFRAIVIPWVRTHKAELFTRLRTEAAKTQTPLDDAFYEWLDTFIEALLPDSNTCLADIPKRK